MGVCASEKTEVCVCVCWGRVRGGRGWLVGEVIAAANQLSHWIGRNITA